MDQEGFLLCKNMCLPCIACHVSKKTSKYLLNTQSSEKFNLSVYQTISFINKDAAIGKIP